jgi:hypothetical protein
LLALLFKPLLEFYKLSTTTFLLPPEASASQFEVQCGDRS